MSYYFSVIKEEKINLRIANKRVKDNLNTLKASPQTIESIYKITFAHTNYTFLNVLDNACYQEISYQEANEKIIKFGSILDDKLNKRNKYVGLLLENSATWIYSFYGLLMYGYIPILLSTKNEANNNLEVLKEIGTDIMISDFSLNGITSINPFTLDLNSAKVKETQWENEVVFISSGTSGPNKIIAFTGQELCEQIYNAGEIIKNNPMIASCNKEKYLKHLVVLPFYHVFGFIAVLLWFSFFNVTFVLPLSLSANHLKQAALLAKPTHIFAVPLFFDTIVNKINHAVKAKNVEKKFKRAIKFSLNLQTLFPRLGLKIIRDHIFKKYLDEIFGTSIRFMITGGAKIKGNTLKVINALGYPLVNGYGSTEVGISSFMNPKSIKKRTSSSIGIPFNAYIYEIKENELYIKSKASFNKSLINKNWINHNHDEPIKTYDYVTKKKHHYYLSGRMDEVIINENGENLLLSDLENNLPVEYADSYIVYKKEDDLILLLSYSSNISEYQIASEIKRVLDSKIYNFNKIKEIYLTRLIFAKANGIKIKRQEIVKAFKENKFVLVDINKYQTTNKVNEEIDREILNRVIKIFHELFNESTINENTDYFKDLNGDSLNYFTLVEKVENAFGVKLDINTNLAKTPKEFTYFIMRNL